MFKVFFGVCACVRVCVVCVCMCGCEKVCTVCVCVVCELIGVFAGVIHTADTATFVVQKNNTKVNSFQDISKRVQCIYQYVANIILMYSIYCTHITYNNTYIQNALHTKNIHIYTHNYTVRNVLQLESTLNDSTTKLHHPTPSSLPNCYHTYISTKASP